jgi:hypothetical protein
MEQRLLLLNASSRNLFKVYSCVDESILHHPGAKVLGIRAKPKFKIKFARMNIHGAQRVSHLEGLEVTTAIVMEFQIFYPENGKSLFFSLLGARFSLFRRVSGKLSHPYICVLGSSGLKSESELPYQRHTLDVILDECQSTTNK